MPPGGSKPVEPEPRAADHLQNAEGGQAGAGRRAPAAAKAASLTAARSHPLTWRTVLNRAVVVAAAGVAIYLVLPGLTEVLASWPRLSTLEPAWSAAAVAAELASFTCYFALQRLALQTRSWFAVVTAGLAGNSISGILPGGSAVGAAVQFEMLATAGFDPDTAVAGLTAFSLLNVGALLGLPILALPAMLAGAPASPGLVHTAFVGIAGFCLVAIFGAILLHTDRPLAVAGRAAEGLANWVTRGRRPPLTGLDTRLLTDRDTIKSVLGKHWRQAVGLTTGRLGFDFCCLLAALRATGTRARPVRPTTGPPRSMPMRRMAGVMTGQRPSALDPLSQPVHHLSLPKPQALDAQDSSALRSSCSSHASKKRSNSSSPASSSRPSCSAWSMPRLSRAPSAIITAAGSSPPVISLTCRSRSFRPSGVRGKPHATLATSTAARPASSSTSNLPRDSPEHSW